MTKEEYKKQLENEIITLKKEIIKNYNNWKMIHKKLQKEYFDNLDKCKRINEEHKITCIICEPGEL